MIRAGTLRHALTLQAPVATQDSTGGMVGGWTTLGTIYGEIQPLSVAERLASQAISPDMTHQITTRYVSQFADPVVTATYRLLYGSRIFSVIGAENDEERDRLITLRVSEGLVKGQ